MLHEWQSALMSEKKWWWATRPPNRRERFIAALVMTAVLATSANSFAGWRLFGEYDQKVAAGVTLIGVVLFVFMPQTEGR